MKWNINLLMKLVKMEKRQLYNIGVDIGGTNTDAVLVDQNDQIIAKTKTATTADISSGFSNALSELIRKSGIECSAIRAILLGTTHATNALLQKKDLYRVGVIRLAGQLPESLPPCFGWPADLKNALYAGEVAVNGGHQCDGTPLTSFCKKEVQAAIMKLLEYGAESLAVIGVFSPIHNLQEIEAANIVKEMCGNDFPISLSHQVGGIGFIERENTTILNAALKKVMSMGFRQLEIAQNLIGIKAPLFITQNNGSMIDLQQAIEYPVLTISAGPTNSFIGASRMENLSDAIIVDIGGTSTDVGLIKNGFPRRSLNTSNIGGVRLNFSMPDVLSIALGGGSYIDLASSKIGPKSAARNIVNESISFGGTRLTLTDIAIAMGYATIQGTSPSRVMISEQAGRNIIEKAVLQIKREVQLMQGNRSNLPVLLVGGGASLLPTHLFGNDYLSSENAGVANAYGAALSEVSGTIDRVVSLEKREAVLEQLQNEALAQAIQQGALKSSVKIVEMQIIPYHYVSNQMARVTILAAGKQSW